MAIKKRSKDSWTLIEEGADLRPERITVAGFIDQWLRDSVAMRVRPSTLTSYQELQNSLRPTLGWLLLAKLRESQVQASYRALLDQGLAPATVLHTHRMLRQALSQAVKWRLIAHNPTDGVDPPRPGRYEAKILDVEDSWRVLEAADETQIGSLVPPTALYRAPSR